MTRNAALSDLFFNYDHPARDKLLREKVSDDGADYTDEEMWDALREDAVGFAMTLRLATGITIAPEVLVDDFLARE